MGGRGHRPRSGENRTIRDSGTYHAPSDSSCGGGIGFFASKAGSLGLAQLAGVAAALGVA